MRINKFFLGLFLILIIAAGLSAEGNEAIDLLKSPDILANGGSLTSGTSPSADILNPAAAAELQRMTLYTSIAALMGDQTVTGYNGSAFNVGVSIPTRSGVITGSGYVIAASQVTEVNAGLQGGLNASFSKELYPGLLTGAGVNFSIGDGGWSASADLGFIHGLGDVGIMQDFKWAVVLSNMGYSSFTTVDSPSVFTPGLGAGFSLINTEDVVWTINSDLSFPSFQNIKFNLGTGLSLFDFAGIQISSAADMNELIAGDVSALIPAFGIYFNLQTDFENEGEESAWSKNDIRTSVSAAPMANGLWAAEAGVTVNLGVVDEQAPVIEIDLSGFGDADEEETEAGTDTEEDETADEAADEVSINWKKSTGKSTLGRNRIAVADDDDKLPPKGGMNKGNINEGPEGEPIVTYLSPNNDGVRDYMEIPISIQDTRYIKGFAFVIENEQGSEVKRIENKEKRPEDLGLANFFERLFYVEKGVDIPETVRWDGIDEGGNVVEDGFYRFFVEAWDDNGNKSVTNKYGLVIDNTPPALKITPPSDNDKIFSPNDDGNKDVLNIVQDGSSEDRWTAVIKSADGKEHKHYIWADGYPEEFSWNGKDDKKLLVADGVYFYYIESTDRAGNRVEGEVSNIIINTQSTPISLAVDASNFAPGIDTSRDRITFIPEVPVQTGISEWIFKVTGAGRTVEEIRGTDAVPESFVYTGKTSDGYISEGRYKGRLDIKYMNGNNPSAESPEIIADTTAPAASAKVSLRVFSPNGDGKKDDIIIYQETSIEDVWYGVIRNEAGDKIRQYKWVNNADSSFKWEGYTDDGKLAPDGNYSYQLYTADQAANVGESDSVSFRLDTEETPVILTVNMEAFSPNGDRVKDDIIIAPVLNVNQGIQSYRLTVLDSGGNIIKTIEGGGRVRESFSWDGFTDAGRKAADGVYSAQLEVVYEKGDISKASTREFSLDSVYPEITLESEYTLFSPDGDGNRDLVMIKQESSSEDLLSAVIRSSDGTLIREFHWQKQQAADVEWDGTDSNGNKVADGEYSYSIFSEDAAGNKTEKKIDDIKVDTRISNVFVTASAKGFTPNNDGSSDKIEFSTIATLTDGVKDWTLEIIKKGGSAIKRFGGDVLPEKIIWDGQDENGRVIEGDFSAVYKVSYYKGNEPVSVTKEFTIDISAPVTAISIAPTPFSPDNDGNEDELTIKMSVEDQSRIESWSLDIVDREGNAFTSFGGKGVPAEKIIWDGIGNNGELVIAAEDYPYKLKVRDIYGNESVKYGVVPVDVLVVKEGDKLKIRIANITFAPDSAELRKDDPEIKEKNIYVLGRLSEILQKYESYKILIEGHAVSVYWADPARAAREETEELQPLSKARAETVKYYLEQLGISGARMTTAGIGGEQPIVPHSDLDNRWKNRRVEFILLK